jgi:hypothetical protein
MTSLALTLCYLDTKIIILVDSTHFGQCLTMALYLNHTIDSWYETRYRHQQVITIKLGIAKNMTIALYLPLW